MRFAFQGWISPRRIALAGVILICGYALVQWVGYFNNGPGDVATRPPPTPGVVDALNRAILIEGGTFISGSDDWDTIVAPGSPYSKRDEYPRPRTVRSFWMQEHEVTNEEYRRFDAGHAFPVGEERRPVAECHLAGSHGLCRLGWWTFANRSTVGVRGERPGETESTRGATRSPRANAYTTVPATRGARSRSWLGGRARPRKASTTWRAARGGVGHAHLVRSGANARE